MQNVQPQIKVKVGFNCANLKIILTFATFKNQVQRAFQREHVKKHQM